MNYGTPVEWVNYCGHHEQTDNRKQCKTGQTIWTLP